MFLVWPALACRPAGPSQEEHDLPNPTGPTAPNEPVETVPDAPGMPDEDDTETTGALPVTYAHLPVLLFHVGGRDIPAGDKIGGRLEVIRDHDGTLTDLDDAPRAWAGDIGIEIHGASSAGFPKASYSFEARDDDGEDLDVSMLDFPEESDWILTSDWYDPTLLRNALAFALARAVREPLGAWEPRTAFAEVYVDEEYEGIYLVTEEVKRGSTRRWTSAAATS
jgi:hypothetical protein